jgi:hypothetical protein
MRELVPARRCAGWEVAAVAAEPGSQGAEGARLIVLKTDE